MKSFSLYEIDVRIQKYLNGNGIFVECGANNGITQSNTYHLELYYGWTGLLVEAIPERAKICKENRPDCIVENYALVSSEYIHKEIELTYYKQKQGMMSLVEGAKRGVEYAEHCRKAGAQWENQRVPTTTLSKLLDKHNMDSVDFFSLDVEGYEAEVLKGLDFERHRPEFILVEQNDDKVAPILEPYYDMIDQLTHHDYLYKLK